MTTPIPIDFPLRGEWFAPNTPGSKIPSHGTDMLAQTYAFDFVGLDPGSGSLKFYRPNPLRYFLLGVRLRDCYGWGRPVYAAAPGTVVRAEDGWPERDPAHFARDVAVMLKNGLTFDPKHPLDYHSLAGNYVIIETNGIFAVYAHCQNGSIAVAVGDKIETGRRLANVGHSGNSTAPHLHFQLMDHPDPWQAKGLPCCFREYEVFEGGAWRRAEGQIPKSTDRIRYQ